MAEGTKIKDLEQLCVKQKVSFTGSDGVSRNGYVVAVNEHGAYIAYRTHEEELTAYVSGKNLAAGEVKLYVVGV